MMKHTPNIPEFKDLTPENVDMGGAVDYMNLVIKKYGPPCNVFCKHFDDPECLRGKKRIREYHMEFGPYDTWYIKRGCELMEPKDNSDSMNKEQGNKTVMALDCFYQQYCGHR